MVPSNTFIAVPFVLSLALRDEVKHLLLLSFFNWPDVTSICTIESIFESILKCVSYTLSFAISVTSEVATCDFLL